MDVPTTLLRGLAELAVAGGFDDDDLTDGLRRLVDDLRAAVPSVRGLRLRLVVQDQPVELVFFLPAGDDGAVASSLRLWLPASELRPERRDLVVLYAGAAGAFVDLAADLGYALPPPASIQLDVDLPPPSMASEITGLAELSSVNRAIGILIDRGEHPDQAYRVLVEGASRAGLDIPTYAAGVLRDGREPQA